MKGRAILVSIFARLFILLCFEGKVIAAENADSSKMRFFKYKDKFIVSLYQSERRFNLGIQRSGIDLSPPPDIQYRSDANRASGIAVYWDKFSLAFDYKVNIPDSARIRRYGKSNYFNFALNFGSGNWMVESSFRKFRGFYDLNSAAYTNDFDPVVSAFFQNPDLVLASHKFKFLWYTNKDHFSPRAPYNCIYRQVKTSAAWVWVSNLGFSRMNTSLSLVPPPLQGAYEDGRNVNGFQAFSYTAGGGPSVTFVIFRSVFLNVGFWGGPDLQWLRISDKNGIGTYSPSISLFGETRASLGINAKNFFFLFSSFNDASVFFISNKRMNSTFFSGSLQIGYRFPSLKGKWIQKMKNHPWYQKL